jgi:hypothetical protein
MATERFYRTEDVALIAGASYRQLDYWVRNKGLLNPLWAMGGSGTHRRWRAIDIFVARALVAFSALGPSNLKMYEAISQTLYNVGESSDARWLIVFGDSRTVLANDVAPTVAEPCWIYPLRDVAS